MFDVFYQYLILQKKAIVPGLGTFYITRKASQLTFEPKTFSAPVWQITFEKNNLSADKNFYLFVARQQQLDETDAIRKINDFTFDIRREFSVYKKLEWPRIGVLTENAEGLCQLESNNYLYRYFPDAAAERIVRDTGDKSVFEDITTHSITDVDIVKEEETVIISKKNDWWIDAVILAVLAIGAICYYYFQNGSLH